MGRFTETVKQFFEPLSPAQRMMFVLLIAGMTIFLGSIFYWTLQPEYSILFGSLGNESAREIVQELEEEGISYRVEDSGRTILVRSDDVHELRMKLASKGFAQADVQGYELFDANALGMTDFMQRINKKRALEGELARSISSLEQVDHARVHLVLPERTPFQETTVEASASVILNLKRGQNLGTSQVEGMTALVAGSVEGLETGAITVLDQNGNRLTDGMAKEGDYTSGPMQMQLRQKTELYLTERGQSMLDRVLGPGNSILRVAAEHDFDRLTRESDIIDPDSRTIISEERRTHTDSDESFQHIPIDEFTPLDRRGETVLTSSRMNEDVVQTRNYEVNTIRELFEKPQGEIKRISASVLLNYKQSVEEDEEGEVVFVAEPYTEDELEDLREVVSSALGIQLNRGDELTMTQIRFFDPASEEQYRQMMERPVPWDQILRWVLIVAALLAFAGLMYGMSQRFREEQQPVLFRDFSSGDQLEVDGQDDSQESEGKITGMTEEEENFYNRKLSSEARNKLEDKSFVLDEIRDFVEVQPNDAASVIRAMMSEENKTVS